MVMCHQSTTKSCTQLSFMCRTSNVLSLSILIIIKLCNYYLKNFLIRFKLIIIANGNLTVSHVKCKDHETVLYLTSVIINPIITQWADEVICVTLNL